MEICIDINDITESGGKGFEWQVGADTKQGFVIFYQGHFRAYINRCPHTGVSLNWVEGQFFDVDHNFLQCSLHGALFQPLDGLCIWGPCNGKSLYPLDVTSSGQKLYISV